MSRTFLYAIIILSILSVSGCKSQRFGPDKVINDGKVPETNITGSGGDVYYETYFGEFEDQNDGSTLVISRAENEYNVSIKLFRLTDINDGFGEVNGGKLVFKGTDASGNTISGKITVSGDTAKLVFKDSTWEYLHDGTTYTFERKHD